MSSQAKPSAPVQKDQQEPGQWINYIPEAFGLRDAMKESPYRWCARESGMWGIATGTAMAIHRVRMGSSTHFAVNIGFATTFLVCIPSYYFCFRTRENKQKYVELMMKANAFEKAEEMPEQTPAGEDHPFLKEGGGSQQQEYVGELPERKEWQEPLPSQDAKDVFVKVDKKKK